MAQLSRDEVVWVTWLLRLATSGAVQVLRVDVRATGKGQRRPATATGGGVSGGINLVSLLLPPPCSNSVRSLTCCCFCVLFFLCPKLRHGSCSKAREQTLLASTRTRRDGPNLNSPPVRPAARPAARCPPPAVALPAKWNRQELLACR